MRPPPSFRITVESPDVSSPGRTSAGALARRRAEDQQALITPASWDLCDAGRRGQAALAMGTLAAVMAAILPREVGLRTDADSDSATLVIANPHRPNPIRPEGPGGQPLTVSADRAYQACARAGWENSEEPAGKPSVETDSFEIRSQRALHRSFLPCQVARSRRCSPASGRGAA